MIFFPNRKWTSLKLYYQPLFCASVAVYLKINYTFPMSPGFLLSCHFIKKDIFLMVIFDTFLPAFFPFFILWSVKLFIRFPDKTNKVRSSLNLHDTGLINLTVQPLKSLCSTFAFNLLPVCHKKQLQSGKTDLMLENITLNITYK